MRGVALGEVELHTSNIRANKSNRESQAHEEVLQACTLLTTSAIPGSTSLSVMTSTFNTS
eukprot:4973117-Amphidinium_carterae.1